MDDKWTEGSPSEDLNRFNFQLEVMDDSWTNATFFEDPAMGNLDDIFATFFTPQQYSSMPIQENAPPAYPLTAPQFPMDAAEPSQDVLHTGEDTILQFGEYTPLPPLRFEFDEYYYSDDTMTTLLTDQLYSVPIQQNNVPPAWPWTTPQFPTDNAEPSQDMLHVGQDTIFQLGGYTSQPPVSVKPMPNSSSTDTGQGALSPSGRTGRHSGGSSSRPYHPFTTEDVIQLIHAVKHHGRRWRRIIQSPHFLNSGRTRGQLMEKWRDMLKTADRQRDTELRELYMRARQIDASLP